MTKAKKKFELLDTSHSLETMGDLISRYWYGAPFVELYKINDTTFSVYSHRGLRPELRVIIRNGRFRFEREAN